jgi:hypothetical protein
MFKAKVMLLILFFRALTAPEETELDTLVANHIPSPENFIQSSDGYIQLISNLADSQAVILTAANTNGGISMTAGIGGIDVDTTNSITLDAAAASNFTTTNGNLILRATAGLLNIDGGSGMNIGNDASSNPILIGTSSNAKTLTIGNLTGASQVNVLAGTGGFLLDTASGGTISLDATGASCNFTVATTGAGQDLGLYVTGSTDSSIILDSAGTGADAIRFNTTGGIDADATGTINLASGSNSGAAITLDAAFNNGGINLSAGSQGIAINATGSGFVGIGHWSGGEIQIGTAAVARDITIGNVTGATSLTLNSGTGAINIGTSIAKTINIGNFTGATGVVISGGSGNVAINSTAYSTITGNTGVLIGNTAGTAVSIGNSSTTTSVNIDSGTFGITIGNNSANSGPIHIGNTSVGKTILIGNSNTAGNITLRWGGSGGFFAKHQEAHTALANSDATLTMDNNSATGILPGILSGTPTASRTLTLPTAANAVAGVSGVAVNDSIDFVVINKSTAGNSASFILAAGTGGSIEGNATVNAVSNGLATFFDSGSGTFRMRFTNVTGGTEAYVVYRIS